MFSPPTTLIATNPWLSQYAMYSPISTWASNSFCVFAPRYMDGYTRRLFIEKA